MKTFNYIIKWHKRYVGAVLACLLLPLTSFAQEPQIKATAPAIVEAGEMFQYRIEVNSDEGVIAPPMITDFTILAGPAQWTSREETMVNGKVVRTVTTTIFFTLSTNKIGKYTIPSAVLKMNGKAYRSNLVEVEVIKADTTRRSTPRNNGGSAGGTGQSSVGAEEVFVRTTVNKSSVYRNDFVIATVKIYKRPDLAINRISEWKLPTFNDFYSQELSLPDPEFKRETLDGRIYDAAVLKKYLLYPQVAGKLAIKPFETKVEVIVPSGRSRSPLDNFFANLDQVVVRNLTSRVEYVTAKELPAGAPASFTGAVGNFNMEASLSKDNVVANEAATFIIKISGTGNLRLITAPKPQLPADFEVYEAKSTENLKNSEGGTSGFRQFEIPIIPRSAGSFTIPPIEFTYFNPAEASYITLKSKELTLNVERDTVPNEATTVRPVTSGKEITFVGQDIRAAKLNPQSWKTAGSLFYGSSTYYSIFILAGVIFIALILILREQNKRRKDVVFVRTRKANSVAKKRLSMAGKFLQFGDVPGFYNELLRACWGYLSDKLNIPISELTRENVKETLSQRGVSDEDIDDFIAVVDECEFARYAPNTGQLEMEKQYANAMKVITKLEQKIR